MKLKYNDYNKMPLKVFNKLKDISDLDAVDYEIELLSILCDCSIDDILDLSLTEYSKIRKDAQFVANYPECEGDIPDKLTINGNKYYICKNLKQVTTAQYIDYQSYLKEGERHFEYLLSCFIIPEGKEYGKDYDIDDVIKDILELDVVKVEKISFFFLNLFLASIEVSVNYWESTLKKMLKKEKNEEMKMKIQESLNLIHSLKNGDGLQM